MTVCETSIAHENPIKILRRACPDIMLAKRRMLKLRTLATYETASIKTKKGMIARGAPEGKNKLFISQPCCSAAIVLIARK